MGSRSRDRKLMQALDHTMVALATLFVAAGISTLALAVLGLARPQAVLALATVLWGLLAWAWHKPSRTSAATPSVPDRVPRALAVVAGVAVVVGSGLYNFAHHGDYVITDRDSGIYVVGGQWIAQHGSLEVDSGVRELLEIDDLVVSGGGQTTTEQVGTLQIQGAHFFHSVMAVGQWVGGDVGFAAVPAVVGSLALAVLLWLSLAVMVDWLAVAVVAALAMNLAWLYTVRANLSEPTLLLVSFAGAALLVRAVDDWPERPGRMFVAGFVAACALTSRIDAGVVLVAFPALVALLVRRHGPGSQPLRALRWWSAGAAAPVLVAVVDLSVRSPRYLHDLRNEVAGVVVMLLVGVVVAVAVAVSSSEKWRTRTASLARWFAPRCGRLATAMAVFVVALFVFAWFVRPELGPDRSHRGGVGWRYNEVIQRNEGLEPDGKRTYAERSLDRINWYTGPVAIAAGAGGLALLAHRLVRGRITPAELITAGLVTPYLLLYLAVPSVDADHPWMIRRFVPTAIPGLLMFAGVLAAALVAQAREREPRDGSSRDRVTRAACGVGALVIAVGCVVWPLDASWSVRAVSWQQGGRDGLEDLCREIEPSAVTVLAAQRSTAHTLGPAIRSFCDQPAVGLDAQASQAEAAVALRSVVDATNASEPDAVVTVVAPNVEVMSELAPTATALREVVILQTSSLGTTIGQVPSFIGDHHLSVWVAEVRPPLP